MKTCDCRTQAFLAALLVFVACLLTPSMAHAAQAEQMYRLYNRYTGEHFYTADAGERDHLVFVDWTYEGIGWNAPTSGDPVYRLYNSYVDGGDHHYTLSKTERDALVVAGWSYEGVGWYSADKESGVPLYRQYNPYATTGTHNYTVDKVENDTLVSLGWRGEGIGWYGVKDASGKPGQSGDGPENPDPGNPGTDTPSTDPTPEQPKTYTVTFDSTNNTSAVAVQVKEGSTVSAPAEPTRDGYAFLGWSTERYSGSLFDFSTPITGDVTLYAQWSYIRSLYFYYGNESVGRDIDSSWTLGWSNEAVSVVSSNSGVVRVESRSSTSATLVAVSAGTAIITVTDKYGQVISFTATVNSPDDLELTLNVDGNPKVGRTFTMYVNNKIASVTTADERILKVTDEYYGLVYLLGMEPGTTTVTVEDVYGQSKTCSITVDQRMYIINYDNVTTETVDYTASRLDPSLAAPQIEDCYYGETFINVICLGVPGSDGYPDGYEVYLCTSPNFDKGFEVFYETDDWNNGGYVRLSPSFAWRTGKTYYAHVRSFNYEGTTKVYGPWGETRKISVGDTDTQRDTPAKYSYEAYFVDQTTGDSIYSGVTKVLYIKTDNPDPSSILLTLTNGDSANSVRSSTIYDDITYSNTYDRDQDLKRVEGGYVMNLTIVDPGPLTVQIREVDASGYAIAKEYSWNVIDYDEACRSWMQGIIDDVTTSDMDPFEKMRAVCNYLIADERFVYITNVKVDGEAVGVTLASVPNTPYFRTHRWDSFTSPFALCDFAELIGGFDEIHSMYYDYPGGTDDWMHWHSYVKLTIDDRTEYYSVCPYTPTGELPEIPTIDFSDTSSLIPA